MCIDLVAEEDKDFKAGDAKPIRIKKATIPKNTLLLISPYGRHGVGQVISIGEEITMPVELTAQQIMRYLLQGSLDLSRKRIS